MPDFPHMPGNYNSLHLACKMSFDGVNNHANFAVANVL